MTGPSDPTDHDDPPRLTQSYTNSAQPAPHEESRRRPRHRVRSIALAVGVVTMLLIGLVFGLRLARGPIPIRSRLIGQSAPSFDLPGLRNGHVSSHQYAGQLYIVNFWASWCVACREEARFLEDFAQRWAGKVTLIGIDWNDTTDAANAFVDEFQLTYPQVVDAEGTVALTYGLTGVPETYLVTPDGIVAGGIIGAVGPTTLDEMIAQVVAGHEVIAGGGGHQRSP